MSYRFKPPSVYAATLLDSIESNSVNGPDFPVPAEKELANLLDTTLVCSLMEEEERAIRFKLAFVSPDKCKANGWAIVEFDSPVAFELARIKKLALVSNVQGVYLGVFRADDNELQIWGLISSGIPLQGIVSSLGCLTIAVIGSGELLAKLGSDILLYYTPSEGGVLALTRVWPQCLLRTLRKRVPDVAVHKPLVRAISLITAAIVAQGHGGTLLLVPSSFEGSDELKGGHDLYSSRGRGVLDRGIQLEDLASEELLKRAQNLWGKFDELRLTAVEQEFNGLMNSIGTLSAIDGAIVLSYELSLLGFGKMICSSVESPNAKEIIRREDPYNRRNAISLDSVADFPAGTRHKSAISFCVSNPQSTAIVVSQDKAVSLVEAESGKVLVVSPFLAIESIFCGLR